MGIMLARPFAYQIHGQSTEKIMKKIEMGKMATRLVGEELTCYPVPHIDEEDRGSFGQCEFELVGCVYFYQSLCPHDSAGIQKHL